MGLMNIFFSGRKSPEEVINEGLNHIRDLYGEILNMERKVTEDVSNFFNYENREGRFLRDIKALNGLSKEHRIKRARELMEREHRVLGHETNLLGDIRSRLKRVVRLVEKQIREIEKIDRKL